jgi:IPTL-CTERM motif
LKSMRWLFAVALMLIAATAFSQDLVCPCWDPFTEAELVAAMNAEEVGVAECRVYNPGLSSAADAEDRNPYMLAENGTSFDCLLRLGAIDTGLVLLTEQEANACNAEASTIIPQISWCDPTGTEATATFLVTKTYSDSNPDAVEVTLSCNTGLPLTQSFMISDDEPVNFVVTNFTQGAMDCEVTETGTAAGYTPSYDNGSIVSTTSCAYTGVASGEYACAIINTAEPATFAVTKDWVIGGAEGDDVIEEAIVTIFCNNEIQEGSWNGSHYVLSDLLIGDGDSLVATVDTTLQSALCWAEEDIVQSGVESEDDCSQRAIPAGGSSSCTITNTVFFEGIPTLSQYGLALLTLLTLSIGFVGLRRFA